MRMDNIRRMLSGKAECKHVSKVGILLHVLTGWCGAGRPQMHLFSHAVAMRTSLGVRYSKP
jgi:hypothetical protein